MVDVSIIIVNWNMCEDIRRCLRTLKDDIADVNLEIRVTIVDNSQNNDGIKEMLATEFPYAIYLDPQKNVGFAAANNQGIKHTPARFYFVLNPDTVFKAGEQIIKKMFDYMQANVHVGMIGPQLLNLDDSLQYSCHRFPKVWDNLVKRLPFLHKITFIQRSLDHFAMKDFDHKTERPVDWLMGAALFVRDEAISDVGMFDDRYFMYFEDCDWCRRMWEYYWQVRYIPHIVLYHGHRRDSAKVPGLKSIIKNPLTRIHLRSWLSYWLKWRWRSARYYQEPQ
jgi:GT2 family glycosyltransferase